MPSFHETVTSAAPPEDVWKLLYDPSRFPDWWAGIDTIEVKSEGEYTMYPDGYPDFPMARLLETKLRATSNVSPSPASSPTYALNGGSRTPGRAH
jgi:hypothetical protein